VTHTWRKQCEILSGPLDISQRPFFPDIQPLLKHRGSRKKYQDMSQKGLDFPRPRL